MKNYSLNFNFSLPERPKFSAADILLKVSDLFVGTVSLAFAAGGAYFGFTFCPFYMTSHIGSAENGNGFFNALVCFVVGLILGAGVSVLSMMFLSYMSEAKTSAKIIAKDKEIIKAYEAEKAVKEDTEKTDESGDIFSTEEIRKKIYQAYGITEAENTEAEVEAEAEAEPEPVAETDVLEATVRFYDLDRTVVYRPSGNMPA